MNKVQTIILKFVAMMSFIAMVFSFCKIDADAMDWGPTNSNRYLIQNLGSNADILDIVEYLDANWFYGIKLCETPYSAACSSCLSLQGTDQSIKNKIEEHMRPGKNGGMNCTGLVGYVYRQKGADLTKITQIRKGWYINATNWHNTASGQGGIANAARTYRYNTIQEMLSAKKAIKGDLIFFEPKNWYASGADCHIGFYWGNYPGHDQFLHNSTHPNRGAQITTVTPKCDSYVYVIKSAPSRITFDKNTTDTVTNMPGNGKKYEGSAYKFPSNIPQRAGYTFKGWHVDKNSTSGVAPGFEWWCEDTNQTVYAIWEKNKTYNVKYVVDGDKQFSRTIEQQLDTDYKVLANNVAKTGYTALNWECTYYVTSTETATKIFKEGATYNNLSVPGTTATFVSKWKANKYTIKYNANGGSGTMNSQSATYDQNVTLNSNKFTKTGYTFLGWSEDSSATTPTYTDRQTVKNLSATNGATVNLYAVWQKNAVSTYLIRFNANGGSGTMANMTCEVGKGYYLTKNAFTKSGFTFKGWATISGSSTVRYTDQEYISDLTTTNGAAITLYAVWESNTKNYTIRFNSNGGYGSMSDMTCTVGSTYQLTRNAFYKNGYSFVGWNTYSGATSVKYSDGDFVTDLSTTNGSVVTLYAVWKEDAKSYTIRFNANYGSGYMSDMNCIVGYSYRLSTNQFTRSGYTFKGWSLSSGSYNSVNYAENAYVTDLSTTNGDTVNLYAVWEKQADSTYTIRFNSNGGSGSMSNMTCKVGTTYYLPENEFTKYGYTFEGWSLNSGTNNSVNYYDCSSVSNLSTVNGDTVTLYAVWKQVQYYYICFDSNGGEGYMSDQRCKYGEYVTLTKNAFTRSGYTFLGWANDYDATSPDYYDQQSIIQNSYLQGTRMLYAVWEKNSTSSKTYTIRFNSNGGSGYMSNMTCSMNTYYNLSANTFTRTGFSFAGWSLGSGNNNSVNWSDKAQVRNISSAGGTVTLYAVWKQVGSDTTSRAYTIIFSANGGTGTMANQKVTSEPVTLNKNQFTKDGYEFAGWKYPGDSTRYPDQASVTWGTDKNLWFDGTVYHNVVIYAQWKEKSSGYTIRFDANGGFGYMNDISATCGSSTVLPTNQFTRTDYTFKGWSRTSGDYNSVKYTDGATVPSLSSTDGSIITLYAVWEKNAAKTYTVYFNGNGATSGYMSYITKNQDEYFALPKNQFERSGYTFQGWAESSTGSKTYNDEDVVSNLASVGSYTTLYAVWKQNAQTYTIHFNANGGYGSMDDMTCLSNAYATLRQNSFYRNNYTFQGWATSAYGSVQYYDQQTVYNLTSAGSSITLYAVWKQNASKYTIHFDSNYGYGSMDDMECVQDEYVALNPNAFYKYGYVFQGWSTYRYGPVAYQDRASVINLTTVKGGTVTLYAVWAKEQYTYTIHFDSNGGSGYMDDMTCKTDEYVTLDQNAFYRDNYTFKGWATYSSGSVEYQDEARVYNLSTTNGDTVTLYAVWEKKTVPYSVIYRWNDQNSLSETKQYNMDTTYNFLTLQTSSLGNIEKPGYSFYRWYQLVSDTTGGWITSDWLYTYYQPGASFKNLTTTENGIVTLYGEWTANNYKIRFNANGGSGSMSDQSATYDQDVTLSANKFKRDGYKFVGWATSSYGYKKYDDEQTVRNLTTANGSIVTLYAVWEQTSQYTIRFDANGGKGSMSDMTCYYGVDVTLPKHTFTKDKADFVGWSLDKNATNPTYGEQATVRDLTSTNNGIVTLYAVWNDIPGVDVDDIYIFKDEKDKVTTEFVEAESNLRIKKNNSETNVLEYHNTNIDDIKADLDADKDETTVKFDVIYNTGYETTATCKLYVIDIVHKDSALARVRYIDDAQYISESSVWSNSTMNTILRNALGVKENMDDIPSTEVEKADTTSQDNSSSDKNMK